VKPTNFLKPSDQLSSDKPTNFVTRRVQESLDEDDADRITS